MNTLRARFPVAAWLAATGWTALLPFALLLAAWAAVTAAGSIAGDEPLAIATVVKLTQNALIGFVAVALTAWFAFKVEPAASASGF